MHLASRNESENVECADGLQGLQENNSMHNNISKMVGANEKIHCEKNVANEKITLLLWDMNFGEKENIIIYK